MTLQQANDRDTHVRSFAISRAALDMTDRLYGVLPSFDDVEALEPLQALARTIHDLALIQHYGTTLCAEEDALVLRDGLEATLASAMTMLIDRYGSEQAADAIAQAIVDIDEDYDEEAEADEDDEADEEDDAVDDTPESEPQDALDQDSDKLLQAIAEVVKAMPGVVLLPRSALLSMVSPGMCYAYGEAPDRLDEYMAAQAEACDSV